MKFVKKNYVLLIVLIVIVVVYKNWYTHLLLFAPDFPFYYPHRQLEFGFQPFGWSSLANNGFGGNVVSTLSLDLYVHIGIKFLVFVLKIPWWLAQRLMLFWPFLIVGTISSFYFVKVFLKDKALSAVGSLVYMTNTYILMLAGGGQLGLVLAYAFVPIVIASFIKKQKLLLTFSLILLVMADLRFTFITVIISFLYFLIVIDRSEWIGYLKFLIFPTILTAGVHFYWIYPSIASASNFLPSGYEQVDWIRYLSFAEFSKSLSLLHPNWPENIFGKTYFTKPEFVFLAIIFFSSLFFINKVNKKTKINILFFVLLGLVGGFLAKGINPPAGLVYDFLYTYVPFFKGFRDPTKFYLVTVLSYSVVIPFVLTNLLSVVKNRKLKNINLFIFSFILIWMYLIFPHISGQTKGTFAKTTISSEHYVFADMVVAENNFNRIMVVPFRNRLVFESEKHPLVDASTYFGTTDFEEIIDRFKDEETKKLLTDISIGYIVIPDDVNQEIFLTERVYDPKKKEMFVEALDKIKYLNRINGFDDLIVYKFANPASLFYSFTNNEKTNILDFRKENAVKYYLNLSNKPEEIIFTQNYDPSWKLFDGDNVISPHKTKNGFIGYDTSKASGGNYQVYYTAQKNVNIGTAFSIAAIIFLYLYFIKDYLRQKKTKRIIQVAIFSLLSGYAIMISYFEPDRQTYVDPLRIWSSYGFEEITNPLDGTKMLKSVYGGVGLMFNIVGLSDIKLHISGLNKGLGTYARAYINNIEQDLVKAEGQNQEYSLKIDKPSSEVYLQFYCSGEPGCDIRFHGMSLDMKAKVKKPLDLTRIKFAVLGDSISTLYGYENYSFLTSNIMGWDLYDASVSRSTLTDNKKSYFPGIKRYQKDIVKLKPDVVLIALGSNDVINGISDELFGQRYKTLVKNLYKDLPGVKIYCLGLFDATSGYYQKSKIYNQQIQLACDDKKAVYIDTKGLLINADLVDGIHPDKKVQGKIVERIVEYITK
ncbi:GDSL-type esterase/lipase family protein [Patescibacteria group bacterium]